MIGDKNIFCASNPAKLADALWALLDGRDFTNDIIFLPSRRAIRTVERMIVERAGATLLPKLIALGEGADDEDYESDVDTVSNLERMIVLAKLLSAANKNSVGSNLSVARDLVRMMDYLETENVGETNWMELVDEKFAQHFQEKARFLNLAQIALPAIFPGVQTIAQKRSDDIRSWISVLANTNHEHESRIIVCGSTGSVPATADLMVHIAGMENGYVLLPGNIRHKAYGIRHNECDPYFSELKFLERISVLPNDVKIIGADQSNIDFLNSAFSNEKNKYAICHMPYAFVRIDCTRESEEAEIVAEIAVARAAENKSVLIVTPDAAANQRLGAAFARRGAVADFSGGMAGNMHPLGREILKLFDEGIRHKAYGIDFFQDHKRTNLFDVVANFVEQQHALCLMPYALDDDKVVIFESIKNLSDIIEKHDLKLSHSDLSSLVSLAFSQIQLRPPASVDTKISVVGTIESRMQTADVVILTGLNEGMFPALGYENPWLPRRVAEQIGLPAPERKVSLMALDFINLSCSAEVFWTRSQMSGGGATTESRFLSRVAVARAESREPRAEEWLKKVRAYDNVEFAPLRPTPAMGVFPQKLSMTALELLIHNPYAFYARYILNLKPVKEEEPGAREFGILVHSAIEDYSKNSVRDIVADLDARAKKILPPGNILLHFWHKRFTEIAPYIQQYLDMAQGAKIEQYVEGEIANRKIYAIADAINSDCIIDIKTGAAPNKSQLEKGMMPQLPLTAYMTGATTIKFLQLRNRDVKWIEYDADATTTMIENTVEKVASLICQYTRDDATYEYRPHNVAKYKEYDDLARV